ncbi:DUF6349 family protein [Tsukamurella sp. DT100]|uniref:DUF6349 family protein n=1 Tax=Tsukamurella sp. DT100 TaxID=3393415 RepID=UPI003CF9E02B
MKTAIDGQLDLFAMLAADETERKRAAGIPARHFGMAGRGLWARLEAYQSWMTEWTPVIELGAGLVVRAWGTSYGAAPVRTMECQPYVLGADLRCADRTHRDGCACVGHLIYRGFCTGCDWETDGEHLEDSLAAIDALDHAHDGWRESPVVEPLKYELGSKAGKNWQRSIEALYGDCPPGWPIITNRRGTATRAVAGRSPWGGYDVAIDTIDPRGDDPEMPEQQ